MANGKSKPACPQIFPQKPYVWFRGRSAEDRVTALPPRKNRTTCNTTHPVAKPKLINKRIDERTDGHSDRQQSKEKAKYNPVKCRRWFNVYYRKHKTGDNPPGLVVFKVYLVFALVTVLRFKVKNFNTGIVTVCFLQFGTFCPPAWKSVRIIANGWPRLVANGTPMTPY